MYKVCMNDQIKRTCKDCNFEYPIVAYPMVGTRQQYRSRRCKNCWLAHKRVKHREWRTINRDHHTAYQKCYQKRRLEEMHPERLAELKARNARKAQLRRDKLRMIVFAAYGGYRCSCCGETEPTFLSIDHVHNDGYARGKAGEPRSGEPLYRMLINRNFPSDFQILCMNCNHGKSRNGGVCPHQKEPSTTRREP